MELSEFIAWVEDHGWKLTVPVKSLGFDLPGPWTDYRAFVKPGEMPIVVPVKGHAVDEVYVALLKSIFAADLAQDENDA